LKKRDAIKVCLVLAILTAGIYAQVCWHQFINFDDNCYVTDNPHIQPGLTWAGLSWAFGRCHGEHTYWHPLTWVSHMLDCQFFGLNPAGHHLTSLLLHVVNVVLVFVVFRRMTGDFWRPAAVAALFALHPLQVDTVAWVAERKNLLSAMFWLLTMWAYVRYVEVREASASPQAAPAAPQVSRFTFPVSGRYALCLFVFACGLMSKPVLVTLPFVMLLLDYWPLRRFESPAVLARLVWEKAPFFLLAAVSCLITLAAHRGLGSLGNGATLPAALRIDNAIVSYVRYLGKTLFPTHLAIFYPYPAAWPVWTVAACALLLLVVSVTVIRCLRAQPFLFVGWFWFLGALVPFIGIIQAGEQAMADRFMYVPLLGLFTMAVWGAGAAVEPGARAKRVLATAAALGLAACCVATALQLRYWQGDETLFRHAVEVTRNNYTAYDGLGSALEAAGRRDEALACLEQCVRLKPRYPEGQYDLGTILLKMGKPEEAARHFVIALANRPDFSQAHINLGKVLLDQGKVDDAAAHLLRGVQLAPDDAEGQYNLGTVLLMQSRLEPAVACFSEALRLKPDYYEAHANLGVAFMRLGKAQQGAAHLATAAQLDPANAEAHNNFGLALLDLNRPQDAVAQFSESLRLKPDFPAPQYHLALALARQNKRQDALPHARKARDLAQAAGQSALALKAQSFLDQSQ